MCATPPVSRDALTHHLAVPALYVEHGGIYEIPDIEFSYYPELLDIIYCIPLMFKNDILPKYIHFLFALLTALLLFCYIKNRLDSFWAILTVIFFISLPVIIKLSATVYVDLGLIFFSFASLLSLLKWRRDNFQLKWLTAAALFCGLALSTKYNGMITLFLLTAFVPFIYLKQENRVLHHQIKAIFYGLLFLTVSLAMFSPWMVKNYIWTQNPVYPLYDNFFNEPDNDQGNDQIKKITKTRNDKTFAWNHFLVRKYVYNETWWETALIPVRIFFQGKDDNPKYFDGKLNPLLFFLPFFAFIGQTSKNSAEEKFEKKVFLAFSFLYIQTVFFQTDMRIRWIGPAVPPLIILSCFGFKNICNMTNQRKTVTIFVLSVF
ncbi:MAG: phospholipid carrier-dependent glycosyltransferase, partial [Candidatus Cloacimonadota bacterium]|nr:phospholipid carrier-dependent glycosyltransferase [Candidatus Cloacimonadota bacterium]